MIFDTTWVTKCGQVLPGRVHLLDDDEPRVVPNKNNGNTGRVRLCILHKPRTALEISDLLGLIQEVVSNRLNYLSIRGKVRQVGRHSVTRHVLWMAS